MRRFARIVGVQVEPIGDGWVAFSPASGETLVLNDETAAVLEVLEAGAASTVGISDALAADSGVAEPTLCMVLDEGLPRLIEAGLVRQADVGQHQAA